MAFDSYLVREEDGTSRFTLEDGSGSIILETAVEVAEPNRPKTRYVKTVDPFASGQRHGSTTS